MTSGTVEYVLPTNVPILNNRTQLHLPGGVRCGTGPHILEHCLDPIASHPRCHCTECVYSLSSLWKEKQCSIQRLRLKVEHVLPSKNTIYDHYHQDNLSKMKLKNAGSASVIQEFLRKQFEHSSWLTKNCIYLFLYFVIVRMTFSGNQR